MSTDNVLYHGSGPAGNDAYMQTRAVSRDGTGQEVIGEGNALKVTDVTSITRTVYDLQAAPALVGTPVSGPTLLTVGNVLSNVLTADDQWYDQNQVVDSIGRNFLDQVPGSILALANHTYRVVYTVVTTGGTTSVLVFEHTCTPTNPG
ncbi:MAG TPA: hypothetical protein VKI17_11625 [Gemmataceae bacterium]|nr:hypothetical protein [Gemmataceae bacterium]